MTLDLTDEAPQQLVAQDGVLSIRVVHEDRPVLEADLLPEAWPFFAASKQSVASGRGMCFRRLGRADQGRVDHTLKRLRRRRHVAWIGAPGLGKSAGVNSILATLLQHLGEEGWPRQVATRVEEQLTVYKLNRSGQVEVQMHHVLTLRHLIPLSRTLEKDGAVLLLELSEDESNPVVHCPTLITLSIATHAPISRNFTKPGCSGWSSEPGAAKSYKLRRFCCGLPETDRWA